MPNTPNDPALTPASVDATAGRLGIGGNTPDLKEELRERHQQLFTDATDLKERLLDLPATCDTEADLAKFSKVVVDGRNILQRAKNTHESEKAPFLRGGKDVDAVFNAGLRDELQPLIQKIKEAGDRFLQAEARRKREAAEAEAQRLAKEAADKADAAAALEEQGQNRRADAALAGAEQLERQSLKEEIKAGASTLDLSRTHLGGGITASVSEKLKCTSFDRSAVDFAEIGPFLSDDAIEKAIAAAIRAGRKTIKGAVIELVASGNYRG